MGTLNADYNRKKQKNMEIDDKKQKSLGNGSNEPSDMTEKSEIKTVSNSQKGVTEID